MKLVKLFCIVFIISTSSNVLALPTAKLTVKVIDIQGNPVEGARVGIGFESPKSEGWGVDVNGIRGLTDSDGLYTAEGETTPYVAFGVLKEGYYDGNGKFNDFTEVTGILGFRKYQPWNPTVTVVLKKIINPIAMYAVNRGAPRPGELPEIPVTGRFVGYDLMVNDWVVPHGLGIHRDFLFKVDIERAVSYRDYDVTLTLKFTNPGDGVIKYTPDTSQGESALRFPYHAPVMGYVNELVQHYERDPNVRKPRVSSSENPNFVNNYFFRVRTEQDDEGNIVGGLYGKIHGQIKLSGFVAETGGSPKPNINFNYYLNPNNNDTNIEYNPEKNLFKGVPRRFRVKSP